MMAILNTVQSLVVPEESFQHILRICNTNVDGKRKVVYALTAIKGMGRRIATLICKKADIDLNKRAGALTVEEIEKLAEIIADPLKYKVPVWFVNRRKDFKTGRNYHAVAQDLDMCLRDDLERLKKIKCERGLRHAWGLKVRGQHTKSTGRRGKVMGVSKKR